ncbi:MAG: Flp family type IVb pilin [Pseudomonadota bacterium]
MAKLACFLRDENGATAIEYALIAAGISIAILAGIVLMGETIRDDMFGVIAAALPTD